MTLTLAKAGVLLASMQIAYGWSTFTVPHVDGADDTPALLAALPTHATNSTILFQQGVHYNIFTPIKFPVLNNVEIRIEGNLSYPTDIPTVQGLPVGFVAEIFDSQFSIFSSNCWRICMSCLKCKYTLVTKPLIDVPRIMVSGSPLRNLSILTPYSGSLSPEATTLLCEAQQTRTGDGLTGRDKQYGFLIFLPFPDN
jgi:hypothetical protein